MAKKVGKRKLERMKRRGDVSTLRDVLADRDLRRTADGTVIDANWERRVAAISALAEIGDAEAEDAVVKALGDKIGPVRRAAVDALAVIKTEAALPRLSYVCATWSDPTDPARLGALRVLVETSNGLVATSYAEGLVSADSSSPPDELDEEAVRRFVELDPSGQVAADLASFLVTWLAPEDEVRASRAELILGWLGESGVNAAEDAALEIDGAGAGAARILGRIGDEGSIPTVRAVLERGTNAEDRRAAAMALAELRTPLAIEPLLGATRDRDRAVRDAALTGLDSYGVMATVALIGGVVRPSLRSVLTRGHAEHDLWAAETALTAPSAHVPQNDVPAAQDDPPPAQGDAVSPATDTSSPPTDILAPAVDILAPAVDTSAPAVDTSAPAVDASAPAVDILAPAVDTSAPATDTSAPATDTSAPATDTSAPATAADYRALLRGIERAAALGASAPAIDISAPPTDTSAPPTDTSESDAPMAQNDSLAPQNGSSSSTSDAPVAQNDSLAPQNDAPAPESHEVAPESTPQTNTWRSKLRGLLRS